MFPSLFCAGKHIYAMTVCFCYIIKQTPAQKSEGNWTKGWPQSVQRRAPPTPYSMWGPLVYKWIADFVFQYIMIRLYRLNISHVFTVLIHQMLILNKCLRNHHSIHERNLLKPWHLVVEWPLWFSGVLVGGESRKLCCLLQSWLNNCWFTTK